MGVIFLYVSAAVMVLTAATHSILGEKRLIQGVLMINEGILAVPLVRQVLRMAWHLTSLLMLLRAAVVIWPGVPRSLVLATGALWLAIGLFDAVVTRGKHVGWPMLAGGGLLAVIGSLS